MWSKVYSGKREAHTEMKKCWFYSVSVTRCLPNLKELTLPSGKTSCKRYIAAWEKDRDNISATPCFKLMAMLQIPILFYPRNEVSVWNKYLVSTIHNRHSWSTGTQTPPIPVGWHIKYRQEIQNWCLTPHINKAASTKNVAIPFASLPEQSNETSSSTCMLCSGCLLGLLLIHVACGRAKPQPHLVQ